MLKNIVNTGVKEEIVYVLTYTKANLYASNNDVPTWIPVKRTASQNDPKK